MSDFNDDLIGKRLYDQIVFEIHNDRIRNERFWACVARTNGELHVKKFGLLTMTTPQVAYGRHACEMMNKKVRHDGAWIVVWYAPTLQGIPTRLMFLWKDRDGDVQTSYITETRVEELVARGPLWACEMGAQAVQATRAFLKDVGVKPGQMIKAAQGQKSVNPKAAPSLL